MSKTAMMEIREAEERAKATVEAARQTANARKEQAEAEGKALLEQTEREIREECRKRLTACQKEAATILAQGEEAADRLAAEMRASAENHLKNAVKILLWGISDQCQ